VRVIYLNGFELSNSYYNVRTAVPFVALVLLEAYSKSKRRYKVDVNERYFIQNLGVAGVVAFIAEGGQFYSK
jgi:hypothetical protein